MNKIKIKFTSANDIIKFINISSKYIRDINIYDGSIVLDGKSIISLSNLELGKVVEVEIITSDKLETEKFVYEINNFQK